MKPRGRQDCARTRPIVAIDGPVGAGKSTVARELARALGFNYVNTGAMYRAVALAVREAGIKPDEPELEQMLAPILRSIEIGFDEERILLNGRDVTALLAEPEISNLASRFSTLPTVRERMRELQRAAGAEGAVVMEGRDIGTAVFPDAEFKFFLDADVRERARRRFAELSAKGVKTSAAEVFAQVEERDRRDRSREHAPLKCAADAIVIDSTHRAIPEVVAVLRTRVEGRTPVKKGLKRV
jgi:CMP/dCMP kinase